MNLLVVQKAFYILNILAMLQTFVYAQEPTPAFILDSTNTFQPSTAIVLSGGGARGIAHIGAIKCMEDNELAFNYITGTSIGAIIGGLYASGYSADKIDSTFANANWDNIFSLRNYGNRKNLFYDEKYIEDRSILTLNFKQLALVAPEGFSDGTELNLFLQNLFLKSIYFCNNNFDSLKYPFRAVATDLVSGQSITIKSGNLFRAVRASSTMPVNFSPVRIDSMILIDGGVMANLPVRQASEFKADMIIAVDVTTPIYSMKDIKDPMRIADQAVSISMLHFVQEDAKLADILIKPQLGNRRNTDFKNLNSMINAGYIAMQNKIVDIKLLQNKKIDSFLAEQNYSEILKYDLFFDNFNTIDMQNLDTLKSNFDKLKLLNQFIISQKYRQIKIFKEEVITEKNEKKIIFRVMPLYYKKLSNLNLEGFYNENVVGFSNVIQHKYRDSLLSSRMVNKIREEFLTEYYNRSSPFVNVKCRLANDSTLSVNIIESILKEIKIHGNEETKEKIIKDWICFDIGDTVSVEKLQECYTRLNNTNRFSNIDLQILSCDSGCVLLVNIKEVGNQTLRLTGRIDDERIVQVGIDFVNENIFSSSVRNINYFKIGPKDRRFQISLFEPSLMRTSVTLNFTGYYDWREFNLYNKSQEFSPEIIGENFFERFGMIGLLGWQVENKGLVNLQYRLENQGYNDYANGDTILKNYTISTLKLAFDYDTENHPNFATEGTLLSISLETNLFTPKKAQAFTKMNFLIRTGWLFEDLYISASLLFGAGDRTLPYPEFYSLGGQELFFGMREDEEMGRQLFKSSASLRYKLPGIVSLLGMSTYLALRYDLGSVWEMPDEIKFSTLKHGLGFSLMLDTPVGPAKFSVGKAFYFPQNTINSMKLNPILLYFSIGMKL